MLCLQPHTVAAPFYTVLSLSSLDPTGAAVARFCLELGHAGCGVLLPGVISALESRIVAIEGLLKSLLLARRLAKPPTWGWSSGDGGARMELSSRIAWPAHWLFVVDFAKQGIVRSIDFLIFSEDLRPSREWRSAILRPVEVCKSSQRPSQVDNVTCGR